MNYTYVSDSLVDLCTHLCANAKDLHVLACQLKKELKQPRPIHGWFCDGFMWDTNIVWITEKNNARDGNHSLPSA